MTESVWWYVLAGFLIGFILSTLWEWLYFRRRRLRMENRRIAELEATVRSLTLAGGSVGHPAATVAQAAPPEYQGPGVFLENEGAPGMPDPGLASQSSFVAYGATEIQPQPTAQPEQEQPPPVIKRTNAQYVERTSSAASEPAKSPEQPPPTVIERNNSQYVERTEFVSSEPAKALEQPPPIVIERNTSQYVERTSSAASEPAKSPEQLPAPTVTERTNSQYVEHTSSAASEPVKSPEQLPAPTVTERTNSQYVEHTSSAASDQAKTPEQPPLPTVIERNNSQYSERTSSAASDQAKTPEQVQPSAAPELTGVQKAALISAAGARAASTVPAQSSQPDHQPQPEAAAAQPPTWLTPAQSNGFAHSYPKAESESARAEAPSGEWMIAGAMITEAATTGGQDEQPPGAPAGQTAESATPLPAQQQPSPSAPSLLSFLPAAPKLVDAASNGSHPNPPLAGKALPSEGIEPGIQRVSSELDDALASLQGLIRTTGPLLDSAADDEAGHAGTGEPAVTGPYAARNLSRGEYTVVRLMQSARQFGRELKSLYWQD